MGVSHESDERSGVNGLRLLTIKIYDIIKIMKRFWSRKKIIRFGITIVSVAAFIFITKILWDKFKASELGPEYITNTAKVSFRDAENQIIEMTSNEVITEKTSLLTIKSFLKDRKYFKGNIAGKMEIIDPQSNEYIGKIPIILNDKGMFVPDWTNLAKMQKNRKYDIIISFPGYLSKRLRDVILSQDNTLDSGIFLSGDINSDGVINVADFELWKNNFGQSGNFVSDFNDDGKVDEKDFAISFGSENFGKTEQGQ